MACTAWCRASYCPRDGWLHVLGTDCFAGVVAVLEPTAVKGQMFLLCQCCVCFSASAVAVWCIARWWLACAAALVATAVAAALLAAQSDLAQLVHPGVGCMLGKQQRKT
eukprot:GHRQ01006216.1.p2 GENE.GHRQ01006216.1~~GHRQ01006216.1.p2  ORF type:complete len:109 (+),score=7.69 GHRQ01006216.1:465-791(+)